MWDVLYNFTFMSTYLILLGLIGLIAFLSPFFCLPLQTIEEGGSCAGSPQEGMASYSYTQSQQVLEALQSVLPNCSIVTFCQKKTSGFKFTQTVEGSFSLDKSYWYGLTFYVSIQTLCYGTQNGPQLHPVSIDHH